MHSFAYPSIIHPDYRLPFLAALHQPDVLRSSEWEFLARIFSFSFWSAEKERMRPRESDGEIERCAVFFTWVVYRYPDAVVRLPEFSFEILWLYLVMKIFYHYFFN